MTQDAEALTPRELMRQSPACVLLELGRARDSELGS